MRIVLVQLPPMPLGPLTLAALAQNMGVDVDMVDFPSRDQQAHFVHHVAGAAVVGFSTVCTKYPRAVLLADELKAVSPETLIVFGGPQATATARETLARCRSVDLILAGEAEAGWASFLHEVRSKRRDWSNVPGAAWWDGANIRQMPLPPPVDNLDMLPMPAYEKYPAIARSPFASIEVGRGCPFSCTFCSTNTYFSRWPRMKSAQRILMEMDHLNRLYGTTTFDFVHDMFTYRTETVKEVCTLLRTRRYSWGCSSRTDTLSEQMMDEMGQAGCLGFYFGIETGSARMQSSLKKNLDLQKAVEVLRLAKRKGFRVTVSIMLGFPQETREDLRDSLLLIAECMSGLADSVQVPMWGPLADTPLTRDWPEFGFDGTTSNFTDTDGQPTPAETELIRSSFALFSTFYYPVGTQIARDQYQALTALIEALPQYPVTRRYLLERDRLGFVNFLCGTDVAIGRRPGSSLELADRVLARYAAQSPHGASITRLLEFDRAVARVQAASPGFGETCLLAAAEARFVLSEASNPAVIGFAEQMLVNVMKAGPGLQIGVTPLP